MIKANVSTDDHKFSADFDAEPFFKAATDDQLVRLADCGFGGDYPADDVAWHFNNVGHKDIDAVFDWTVRGDVGFECHVDQGQALAWILANRPHLIRVSND